MNGKIMIIGSVGAGKSSLLNALFGNSEPARKTQSLEFRDWIIDTPGEYTENPMYYRTLMATSFEARMLLMIQDATRTRQYFPPGFSEGFPIPAIGVITKIDHPSADVKLAEKLLRQSFMQEEIWHVSALTLHNVQPLKERLISFLFK
jgi:ethanolamine utilization protein EutP